MLLLSTIFVYDSKLYGANYCGEKCKMYILENKQFEYDCGSMKKIFKTDTDINPLSICLDNNNDVYNYGGGMFSKNGNSLQKIIMDSNYYTIKMEQTKILILKKKSMVISSISIG